MPPLFGFRKPYELLDLKESLTFADQTNSTKALVLITLFVMFVFSRQNQKHEIREVDSSNYSIIQKSEPLEIERNELESKSKDFRSLIVAMQGKNDDVTAIIGKQIFNI